MLHAYTIGQVTENEGERIEFYTRTVLDADFGTQPNRGFRMSGFETPDFM